MLLSTKPLRGNPHKNETKKPFKINKSEKKGTYFLEVRFHTGLELTLGIYYPVSYRRQFDLALVKFLIHLDMLR